MSAFALSLYFDLICCSAERMNVLLGVKTKSSAGADWKWKKRKKETGM